MKKKAQSVRVWNVKEAVLIAEMCFFGFQGSGVNRFCLARQRF